MSTANLVKDPENKRLLDNGQLLIVTGDGRQGYPEEGFPRLCKIDKKVHTMQFTLALPPRYARFYN
jgi:hypothetical protein